MRYVRLDPEKPNPIIYEKQYVGKTYCEIEYSDQQKNLDPLFAIEEIKKLINTAILEGWNNLEFDCSLNWKIGWLDSDYNKKYPPYITIYGDRLETEEEYKTRIKDGEEKMNKYNKRIEDNKNEEYKYYLKLKEKYEPTNR